MNTGIYKIENVVNGKCYIGQSIGLNRRKIDHFYKLNKGNHYNKHLQRAYKKYGKKSFRFSILLYCEDFELTRYEQELVNILDPEYNICKECVDSTKGIKHTEETRRKMILDARKIKKTYGNYSESQKALIQFRESLVLSTRQFTDFLNQALPQQYPLHFTTVAAWEQGRNPVSFWVMFYLSHKSSGELQSFAKLMCKEMAG